MTDRELLEKAAINSKVASDAAQWTKNYLVASSVIALILFIISILS